MKTNTTKGKPVKKKKNYLNNKDMLKELRKCHEQDRMTENFAKMIMLLADRYASRYEYAKYSPHIEDMKADAILNIAKVWRSFDFDKSNNPFAYFTQSITYSFWQYVAREKKHRLVRDHLLLDNGELPSDTYLEDYEKELEEKRNSERLDREDEDYNSYDDEETED